MTTTKNSEGLTVAVRQWHEPVIEDFDENDESQTPAKRTIDTPVRWPDGVLLFDVETTTDRAQRLIFGWYRYARWQPDGTL